MADGLMKRANNQEQRGAGANGRNAVPTKRCCSRLNLPCTCRGTLSTWTLTLWLQRVLPRSSGRLCIGMKNREENAALVAAAVPFCFAAKAARFTLHGGFNHAGSLKARIIKGGWVQCSPALMLHESRWRHEKRMGAGKGAAGEKEIPATNKSLSNLSSSPKL